MLKSILGKCELSGVTIDEIIQKQVVGAAASKTG